MNKKLMLPQTIVITLACIAMILAIFDLPGLYILTPVVSAMFVVISALTDNRNIGISLVIVVLALIFFINPVYIFDISLNCILPGIIMGIVLRRILGSNENRFEPVFSGTIAFIVGIMANYVALKYLFNIDMLQQFTDGLKVMIADQITLLQQSTNQLFLNEENVIQSIVNIMPVILFFRAILLAMAVYFISIFLFKRIVKLDLGEIKFSKFYLPGNAVMFSFVAYILIMLLGVFKLPLNNELILMNSQAVFYILFFVQGVAVFAFYVKKWMKKRQFMRCMMICISVVLFGIFGVSMLGMVDSVFDFRKVKNCELT